MVADCENATEGWSARVALDWLNNLAVLAVDGAIDGMALQLSAQLPGAVGAVLAQAAAPGPEVIAVLKREPQAELQALLDALEPLAMATSAETAHSGKNLGLYPVYSSDRYYPYLMERAPLDLRISHRQNQYNFSPLTRNLSPSILPQ